MNGFEKISECVFKDESFFEFEATTLRVLNKNVPISGGGYLRILPWSLMKFFLLKHIAKNNIYTFFIHPFELSNKQIPFISS